MKYIKTIENLILECLFKRFGYAQDLLTGIHPLGGV
jgi:hypothetical protein